MAAAVKAIEKRGVGETAGRVLRRMRAVLHFVAAHERLGVNPMVEIKPAEVLKPRQVKHRAALAAKDLPAFLERMLDLLDACATPTDMAVPGFKFHELKGDRKGTFSISVTGNYRITFRFEGEDAVDVDLEDYH